MKKSFGDQPAGIKVLICGLGAIQIALLGAAHRDLSRRDASEIRGSKGKWRAITLINFIGPLWYFARGRRSTARRLGAAS